MSEEIDPPPPDAVALYIRWQAARERRIELERTLPPADETTAGGIVMPVRDPRLIEADQAEHEALLGFYRHPWWYGTASRPAAERAIEAAARAILAQQQDRDDEKRPHPEGWDRTRNHSHGPNNGGRLPFWPAGMHHQGSEEEPACRRSTFHSPSPPAWLA